MSGNKTTPTEGADVIGDIKAFKARPLLRQFIEAGRLDDLFAVAADNSVVPVIRKN